MMPLRVSISGADHMISIETELMDLIATFLGAADGARKK